jgi:hypothetical protein
MHQIALKDSTERFVMHKLRIGHLVVSHAKYLLFNNNCIVDAMKMSWYGTRIPTNHLIRSKVWAKETDIDREQAEENQFRRQGWMRVGHGENKGKSSRRLKTRILEEDCLEFMEASDLVIGSSIIAEAMKLLPSST